MKNIYSANLEATQTTTMDGSPCEWQWIENMLEEYGHEWDGNVIGYVLNLLEDDEFIIDNSGKFTIHNEPENAVILCNPVSGYPAQMFWAVDE